MRFDGFIKSWNDERGFGFIEPTQGGQQIFFRIQAFRVRHGRRCEVQPCVQSHQFNPCQPTHSTSCCVGTPFAAGLPHYHAPMPIDYARSLTHHQGSQRRIKHLGFALAFVAGAANAGAFLSVKVYTSHMTGIVSSIADHLALGEVALALAALSAVTMFLLGAVTSAVMINFARRRLLRSQFALPLLLEAALFLLFGLMGSTLAGLDGFFIPATVMLLCFTMGLQNAVITKISGAVVRTTHLTGVITDLGIEIGKLVYWNRQVDSVEGQVVADRERMKTLGALVLSFLVGGVLGALGFKQFGFAATIPLALILFALSAVPVIDDLRGRR